MNYKEAAETLSAALAIANARCRELEAENAHLRATNDKLLTLLEGATEQVRGMATGKTSTGGVFLRPSHTQPRAHRGKAVILTLHR